MIRQFACKNRPRLAGRAKSVAVLV